MQSARSQDEHVIRKLASRGIVATQEQARALRRAERTLHAWHEQECGTGNAHASWHIERDEATNKPYRVVHSYAAGVSAIRYAIPDRERGAIARISQICKDLGACFYVQSDPRGCALYVDREPLDCRTYYRGAAVCGE